MEELPVDLDDYRELASFLEQQIAEASASDPGGQEVGELRARLEKLHAILAQAHASAENAERLLQDQFEAAAFELKMKQRQPSRPGVQPTAQQAAPAPRGAPRTGSVDQLEALVSQSPGDDALRRSYVEAAEAASMQPRAAEVLARIVASSKQPDVRERVGYDLALLYFGEGELPAARAALLGVVTAGAGGPASLAAARRLLNFVDADDVEVVGAARELLAKVDPDPKVRRESAEAIFALHRSSPQKDARLAFAYKALIGGDAPATRTNEALSWLRRFYVKTGNAAGFMEWLEHSEHWEVLAKVLEGDIDLAPAKDKGRLLTRLGEIRLVRMGDANGAIAAFSRGLAADPVGSADGALAAMTKAHASMRDRDRHDLTLRIARALSRKDLGQRALDLCRQLFVEPSLEPAAVQEIADIAHDEDDNDLYRHAIEYLSKTGDDETRKKALEQLGDFQFAQLGDRKAAAESWRPAARLHDAAPEEKEQAQALYERVLDAIPDDRDAAGRLAEIYASTKDWAKLPDVLKVLVGSGQDQERTSRLLLDLEKSAGDAGEVEEYATLVETLVAKLPALKRPGDGLALKRAKARVLASDPARFAEAAAAHREVIEASLDEADVRAFEAFLEAGPSAEERLHERRWLYERRVAKGPKAAETLLEWARAEEDLGERDAALALYVRLAELAPSQREGLEALCRLKLVAGDFEGGLAALRALRDLGTPEERRAAALQTARVLLEDLGRPAEAAIVLAPLLDVTPPLPAARQMMRKAMGDPAVRAQVADSVESLAKGEDRAAARRVLELLIDARDETAALADQRRKWFERLVELSAPDAKAVLATALRGVVEQPDADGLWSEAERAARQLGQPDAIVKGYRDALVDQVKDPKLAEKLGSRMIAFSRDFAVSDSPNFVAALQRLLELAPGTRWALDRVKLVLGSAARWDDLFLLYDRAIEAVADEKERAALLDEAARAARDVAGQPERAIPYLEAIHLMRPADAAITSALERAYERQGRAQPLIALLSEGLQSASGFRRSEMLQRIASLWLDLGDTPRALETLDKAIADGSTIADVNASLERIGADPAAGAPVRTKEQGAAAQRAIAMLREHYEKLGQAEDVVRMVSRQLATAEGGSARGRWARDLRGLLARTSKLTLEKNRRRQLLREAAVKCAERSEDREHAIAFFGTLFEEDAGDDAAAKSVETYGTLLGAAGQAAKLARLWEEQAKVHAAAKKNKEQRACWEKAAEVWRRTDARADTIAAYKQAAALDSESAYEGLASLHEESREWADAATALEWLYAKAPQAARGQRALRLSEAYVALGDRARARESLERALDAGVEADRIDAVSDALVTLYRADGAWKPLADRLVTIAGRAKDADKKLALLREAAELMRDKVGALAEAASLFEKVVALKPADPTLRPLLVDVLENVDRWDRAVEVLREQLALYGATRTRERALCHRRLARALVRAGHPKEALPELKSAAEMLPGNPAVLHDLARASLELGQLDVTESTCRALLLALLHPSEEEGAAAPHRAEVFIDLAEVAMRRDDVRRAKDLVDSAVEAALESGDPKDELAPVLAARGRYGLLAHYVEQRLQRGTSLAGRATALGTLAETWSKHLAGEAELRARIAQHASRIGRELEHDAATEVGPWAALASVYDVLGDAAGRASTERRLVALLEGAIAKGQAGPARAALWLELAKARLHKGATEDAIAALKAAAEEDPEGTDAVALLADTLSTAGNADEAIAALRTLLARKPGDSAALERLASLVAGKGDWDAAIEAYGKALGACHDAERIARMASELADVCEKAGRPEDARDALERALSSSPDNAPLTERLARICEQDGDWKRLARLADTLRAKNPENIDALLLWSHALRGLSRGAETIGPLEHALERNKGKRTPVVARLLLEAASAHLAVDEIVEAFDHLKTAYGIDARNAEGSMLLALVAIDLDDDRTAERALFTVTGSPPKTDADRRAQATAFYHLAAMALAKGDGPKARRLAGKALSMEPGHPHAQALLEKLDSQGSGVVARSSVAPSSRTASGTPRS